MENLGKNARTAAVRRGSPLDYDHHAGHPDVGILRAASQGVSEEGSLIHFFDPAAVGGQQRGEVVHHVARDAGHASMGDQRLGQLRRGRSHGEAVERIEGGLRGLVQRGRGLVGQRGQRRDLVVGQLLGEGTGGDVGPEMLD
jgi:hypothetical protein